MKYLSSQPFTVAVRTPKPRDPIFGRFLDQNYGEHKQRREKAAKPHEYENGGSMCGLCGLDEQAKIHCQHPFEKRMVEYTESIVDGKKVPKKVRDLCGVCDYTL